MRILWLCNICPPAAAMALGQGYSVREGWLTGALERFLRDGDNGMELGICFPAEGELASFSGEVVLRTMEGGKNAGEKKVSLFGLAEDLRRPEIYESGLEERSARILAAFSPDLVHIFGTEFPHALAMVRSFHRPERTLVGIQGLIGACAESYRADLPDRAWRRITLRDALRGDSLRRQQEKFRIRGEREREVLRGCGHVTGRTGFDREGSLACNPALVYHKMNETMRPCFYEGKWEPEKCRSHEIFISQGDYPLKGFHYLLGAMRKIREAFPDARIRVAGNTVTAYGTVKEKLKISGYGKYLRECISRYGLEGCVEILGRLDGEGMKAAYLHSHVYVCPSSLENSPNSLGEAMLLGVPCVASRVGGIPDMAEDGESALFFEKGNEMELAQQILEIFRREDLARHLSEGARKRAREDHDGDRNYARLMEIYQEIAGGQAEQGGGL